MLSGNAHFTGGARHPPRLDREGKLELTKAPRSRDRGCGNSRRLPPGEARADRSGRYVRVGQRHTSLALSSRSSAERGGAARRLTLKTLRRFVCARWHTFRAARKAVLASPPTVRTVVILATILLCWLGVNWAYHAFNKPTEVFFPLDHSLDKHPAETWKQYGSLFRKHATAVMTPELLAALAQVEGGGNPVARTYWRWRLTWNPLELYQPASSAVGMYQITDGTFQEATRYCIHNHRVVEDGPWHDPNSCWFNSLYSRVVPSHAIELTAALLDRRVASAHRTADGSARSRSGRSRIWPP